MSDYRNADCYTLNELRDANAKAEIVLSERKQSVRDISADAHRIAMYCRRSAQSLLLSFAVTTAARAAHSPMAIAAFFVTCLLAAVTIALFAIYARAEMRRMDALLAARAAHADRHRADAREHCEAMRIELGTGGRCGCDQCEADPLGFFGPYRKDAKP